MLQLKGKTAIVIGGGIVATRKIKSLLRAEANVVVISPEVTSEIREWTEQNQLIWISRSFQTEDVQKGFLVIAATNKKEVNHKVFESVRSDQLINIVDRPEVSNFIVPSTIQRGKLVISVSTSGASPGLARKIRTEIADTYDDAYESYILFLEECRLRVLAEVIDSKQKQKILKELLHPSYLELTRLGLLEERKKSFLDLLRSSNL
jgi:precorrin-2 dehydrogenase/sirohydrochlorin ferrochelatase